MAEPKIDLRKQPTDQLPKAERTAPGITGKLPFSVGSVVLTPGERAELQKVGWKEGDPIPNLSEMWNGEIAKDKQALKEAPPASYDEATTPKPKIPAAVSIESLPPDKRREIEEAVAQMRAEAAAITKRQGEHQFAPADPSVARAMAFAEMQQGRQPKIAVEDDLKGRGAAHITRALSPEPAITPPAPPAPPAKPDAPVMTMGVAAEQKYCPHCRWDLSVLDSTVTTLEDRRIYMAAFLGGQRFKKSYELFDGTVKVVFRAITSEETDSVLRQLFMDGKAGRVSDGLTSLRRMQDYQLACSLEAILTRDNSIQLDTIDAYAVDKTDATTGLPDVVSYVFKKAVQSDSMRRILVDLYIEFDNLVAKLEVEASQPGFTSATGPHR